MRTANQEIDGCMLGELSTHHDIDSNIYSLPTKYAGLGIFNPLKICKPVLRTQHQPLDRLLIYSNRKM